MNTLDLLTAIVELNSCTGNFFIDLHIINNEVVGFYKTRVVTYRSSSDISTSYLFPTTFRLINNRIENTMTFGSVERNFTIPKGINGTDFGTTLQLMGVGNHIYKLLVGRQYIEYEDDRFPFEVFEIKSYICIIQALDSIDFPFMRIANNESINRKY
jgi:hypothetical protein